MGKRSEFEKIGKDVYLTPKAAVLPLVPFLPKKPFTFAEPCAGDGRLVNHLEELTVGKCTWKTDIDYANVVDMLAEDGKEPYRKDILQKDALDVTKADLLKADMVITNPPWSRDKKSDYILHKLIDHFASLKTTWFLFDGDWAHTKQAQPYLQDYCSRIVSVGRVKWIEDSTMSGKDNCAWYEFTPYARQYSAAPLFYGRGIT